MTRDDPYTGFQFRLNLSNVQIAGFAECTGLEMETKQFEYKEGGRNTHVLKFPEQTQQKNVVLKRGLTSSYELYDWYMDIATGTFDHANQRPSSQQQAGTSSDAREQDINKRLSIALINAAGEVQKEWLLRRAFPVKWAGPDFKSTDNGVAFETIELAHEGIEKAGQ